MRTFGTTLLAASFIVADAQAEDCVRPADLSALKTAAIQQELMVAAFTCRDIARYNHFVLAHQSELIDSDARLKAFFVRRDSVGGEKSYHAFKTDLANASSLRSLRETESFCSEAGAAFDLAAQPMSLSAFVAVHPLTVDGAYASCPGGGHNAVMAQTSALLPPPRSELFGDEKGTHGAAPGPTATVSPRSTDRAPNSANGDYAAEPWAPAPHHDLEEDDRRSDADSPRGEDRRFHGQRDEMPLWTRVRHAFARDYRDKYEQYARDRYGDRPNDWRDDPRDDERDD